jgi:hypothetical protein
MSASAERGVGGGGTGHLRVRRWPRAAVAFVLTMLLVAVWSGGAARAALPSGCLSSGSTVTCTFTATGEQVFTVPAEVSSLHVVAIGGHGGSCDGAPGGFGANVTADQPVIPGQVLYVEVAGNGGDSPLNGVTDSGAGGFNGGGSGAIEGGGGGGASDLRMLPIAAGSLGSRLVVAAGGGGSGGECGGPGGPAGGAGTSGTTGPACSGSGGGAGTSTAGGLNGTGATGGGGCGDPGGAGASGSLGTGGAGGPTGFATGGGGGGGGYFGGGGGGGGASFGPGAGGGGGSNLVPPGGSASADATGVPSVTISYGVAVAQVSSPSLSFPTQAQSTVSAPQAVTVTNSGLSPLVVTSLTFAGTDPQDYLVTSNGCLGPIAVAASCTVGLAFAPQAQGASSATLQIASNDLNSPTSVSLSGTGGQLPTGPTGPIGLTGAIGPAAATGATGKTGPRGPAGQIELVVCQTVTKKTTKHGRKVAVKVKKCTARLVSGPVKFTIDADDLGASVSRAGVTYATGFAIPTGTARWQLVLTRHLRTLRPGRYTLTLRSRHGAHRILERRTITIT